MKKLRMHLRHPVGGNFGWCSIHRCVENVTDEPSEVDCRVCLQTMPKPVRYTVEDGRGICRDGKRVLSIHRCGSYEDMAPEEADRLTHEFCAYLNAKEGRCPE